MQAVPNARRLAVLFLLTSCAVGRAEFKLTDSDRIVLFGDTAVSEVNTLAVFDQFVRTKYPDRKPLVCNLGKPRGDVTEGPDRLEREVYPLKPTEVVLCFGLEGPTREAFNQATLDAHMVVMNNMIEALRGKNIRVALLTPPPTDDKQSRGLQKLHYRERVDKYAEAIRELGKRVDAPVIDWNAAVDKYVKNFSSKKFPGWTRHGVIPSWYSHTMLADVLLEHWGAEPLDYEISADWKAGTATASIGTAKVTEHDDKHLLLDLQGVPTVVNMLGGQGMEPQDWPLSRWFTYRMTVTNAPDSQVVISAENMKPLTLPAGELQSGIDAATTGPLVNQPATLALHDAILRKCYQFTQYRVSTEQQAPEPELAEGFRLLHAAQCELALGA
ncbi:MAG: hypothetical protein KDA89_25760, partial [Planctomycetaceae bacterium]|nr:hypothetical protein [Planctomycetaceae bacterium]